MAALGQTQTFAGGASHVRSWGCKPTLPWNRLRESLSRISDSRAPYPAMARGESVARSGPHRVLCERTFCYTTQEGLLRPMRHNPHHHLAARYVLEAQGAVEVLGIAGVEEPAQHLAEPLMSKDRLHKPIPEATRL